MSWDKSLHFVTRCDPDSHRGVCPNCLGIIEVDFDERDNPFVSHSCRCWEDFYVEVCADGDWVWAHPRSHKTAGVTS